MEAQSDQRQSSSNEVEVEAYLEAPVKRKPKNGFCAERSTETVRLAVARVGDGITDDSQVRDGGENAKDEAANQGSNVPSEAPSKGH